MALEQEPIADAIARADQSVRFTATAGEENGPYRIDAYALVRGGQQIRAAAMVVDGKQIAVTFMAKVEAGDTVVTPT